MIKRGIYKKRKVHREKGRRNKYQETKKKQEEHLEIRE